MAKKKTDTSSQPKDNYRKSSKWKTLSLWTSIICFVAAAAWYKDVKINIAPINKTVNEEYPIGSGSNLPETQVVARTKPEAGEILPTSIIKTEKAAEDTSITVLTETKEKPEVIDVTQKLVSQNVKKQVKGIEESLKSAHFVQTTLQMAGVAQSQNMRIIAVYTAINNNLPESRLLLNIALKNANTPKQKESLGALMASIENFGIVTAEKLLSLAPKTNVKQKPKAVVPVEISQTSMPDWWSKTLGKVVKINKISDNKTSAVQKNIDGEDILAKQLKEKNWPNAIKLLSASPYKENKDYTPLKEKINALVIQRQILQELILEAME